MSLRALLDLIFAPYLSHRIQDVLLEQASEEKILSPEVFDQLVGSHPDDDWLHVPRGSLFRQDGPK